jgi:tRNA threonylcarbamoyladenosine biosynthesis protein TsaE
MAESSLPNPAEFTCHRDVRGPEATARLGEDLAGLLNGGEIILLYGSLGSGKTCFTQGLCRGLAVSQDVVSPTFTLVNTYTGRLVVHHLDFYRIAPGADLADVGVPDILDQVWDRTAVAVVEWPELFLGEMGPDTPRVELLATGGADPDHRTWHLRGFPQLPESWAEIFSGGNREQHPGE